MTHRKIDPENEQGVNEAIFYELTTTLWGPALSNIAVHTVDVTAGFVDVSEAVQDGDPSIEDDTITLPQIKNLTAGHVYRVAVRFQSGGNVFEPLFVIYATR
ncbi:hypothetical protein SY88_23675 [Clostridiales bacterium PH28_bin88]|nr:hypothetical protein SY88_23675 [Clostridiales bacterium PH28_bin88]